jgi:intracellular sulfur oxidation DsrE/DsrF family protein
MIGWIRPVQPTRIPSPTLSFTQSIERSFHVSGAEKPLHIDIPVKLTEVKVVFSVGALAFEGDLPASMFHLQLIENDIADWNAKSQVIAVFHTNAGHVTLHDIAYNADRNIATGNPYKGLIADLMKRGAQIELCGATAKAHGWGNADLLPGIKVNTDAMARTTQLVQEGFVKITE